MNYQTYPPHPDLESFVKYYWTLKAPAEKDIEKQRIIPDGCIELIFILGDDIKRYTSETEYIIQPRALVVGQITEPFIIQPTGYVHCFAVRFYPYGFANFTTVPISDLANKETPISLLFGEGAARSLEQDIIEAENEEKQMKIIETFLLNKLTDKSTVDNIVKTTIDALLLTKGSVPIHTILGEELSKRRQLERAFFKQVGLSPKQLGKVIRLQTALKLLLDQKTGNLTQIAYESEYYDQAHFIKDFKEFTGVNPKAFLDNEKMALSSIFYTNE